MINPRRRVLLTAASAALLAGCDVLNGRRSPVVRCDYSTSAKLGSVNLVRLFEEIAKELCQSADIKCSNAAASKPLNCNGGEAVCETPEDTAPSSSPVQGIPLLVPDFVRLDSLASDNDGLVMGELLRTSLSRVCCRKIIQAEVGRDIRMGDRGVVTLTRNSEKIRATQLDIKDVVVGTYHNYPEKLILSVKLIDTSTQTLLASVNRELVHRCDKSWLSVLD